MHLRASSVQLVEDQQHQVEHKDVIDEPGIVETGLTLEHLVDDREKAFWAELLGQVTTDLFLSVLEACLDANECILDLLRGLKHLVALDT